MKTCFMTERERQGQGGTAVTVIYVDTLFLLNALVDYVLLLGAARLAGEPLCRLRFAVGAIVGGGYAVAIFLPGAGFLQGVFCRLAVLALMCVAAYGGSRRLLRQSLLFLALSCALGGGVLMTALLGGRGLTMSGGVLYSVMDLKIVLLSAAGCYAGATLLFRGLIRHTAISGELVRVRVELAGRSVTLTALRDTGNTLTDPATGRPVLVAEGVALLPLLPPETLRAEDLADAVTCMEKLKEGPLAGRVRLLPYRAVGVERGLLLALRTDGIWVDGQREEMLAALSPTPVSDSGGYRALI